MRQELSVNTEDVDGREAKERRKINKRERDERGVLRFLVLPVIKK